MGQLYQQLLSWENLLDAWSKVRRKKGGSPGYDGMTVEKYQLNAEQNLRVLQRLLQQDAYRPAPMMRFFARKQSGDKRAVCIPTIQDRIVQCAAMNIVVPRLDKRFSETNYAYRPGRSIFTALTQVQQARDAGCHWVLKTDIADFFNSLSHPRLKGQIVKYIRDEKIQNLFYAWVRPELIDKENSLNRERMKRGVPQGAVVSPLLANLYLDGFDKQMAQLEGTLVRYADDMLVLCRERREAESALERIARALFELELLLNEGKTFITHFSQGFRFLGAEFKGNNVVLPDLTGASRKVPVGDGKTTMAALVQTPLPTPTEPVGVESDKGGEQPLLRTLYIQQQGTRLSLEKEVFLVSKDSQVLLRMPARKVSQIAILGTCQVTSHALRYCLYQGIPVVYMSTHGKYYGQTEGNTLNNSQRHALQFESLRDPGFVLTTAWRFVVGKVANSDALLRFFQRKFPERNLHPYREQLSILMDEMELIRTKDELLGYEGASAVIYFEALRLVLPEPWQFLRRQRQPPPDPVNSLLSLGYTFLFQNIYSLLRLHGLNPYAGYLHSLRHSHPALASDLVEEFRAIIVDQLVLSIFQQNRLAPSDFTLERQEDGQTLCRLSQSALKQFTAWFEQRLQTQVVHPLTGYRTDYRRCMELQVIQFLNYLEGQLDDYQPFSPANW